jgi:glycosyltransferase involved in cell wall biosynthesis
MKIVVCPYNWNHQPLAGGELYLMRLIKSLPEHEFRIITGHSEYYEWEGIPCYPQGKDLEIWTNNNEHISWCDVILTQLMGTAYAYNKANQHSKPLIFIAHNNGKSYPVKYGKNCHIIYNSFQLRDDLFTTVGHFNGTVLHPILSPFKKCGDKYVTLINCNYNKGGHILIELAKKMPDVQFLGVLGGYGEQITETLPNLTYLPNGTDMQKVYAETKILIAPSEFESYSQASMEAIQCGIPVIANELPGIQENLAYAGIFVSRNDVSKYADNILYLISNSDAYQQRSLQCLKRSESVTEMSKNELLTFKNWLIKIK